MTPAKVPDTPLLCDAGMFARGNTCDGGGPASLSPSSTATRPTPAAVGSGDEPQEEFVGSFVPEPEPRLARALRLEKVLLLELLREHQDQHLPVRRRVVEHVLVWVGGGQVPGRYQ